MSHGGSPNLAFIGARPFAAGRIDHQINLAVLHVVDQVRPAFLQLVHRFNLDSRRPERLRRPLGADEPVTHFSQRSSHGNHLRLVTVGHGNENRSLLRKRAVRRQLALGEGRGKAVVDSHDLARRTHLRTEHNVHARELVERKDALLHRKMMGRLLLDEAQFIERPADHHQGGIAR